MNFLKEQTIYEVLKNTTNDRKNNTSFIFNKKKFSYNFLLKRVNQYASMFKKLNYKKDDVITICLPNVPQTLYLLYAINQIGAIANLIHPLIEPCPLNKIIEITNVTDTNQCHI